MTDVASMCGTCTAVSVPTTLTYADIVKLKEELDALPPEPFKQLMVEQGRNPDDGWTLIIPRTAWDGQTFLPSYVKLSMVVTSPVIVPTVGGIYNVNF